MRLFILLFTATIFSFYGCKSSSVVSPEQLAGKWILETINGEDAKQVFGEKLPTLELNMAEKRVSGSGGCNSYSGSYTLEKNMFSVSKVISTMMMCHNSDKEGEFMRILANQSNVELLFPKTIEGGKLAFIQNGKRVLVFSKAGLLKGEDLSGIWKLQSIEGTSSDTFFRDGKSPTIEFDFANKRISGFAGCNRYNSAFDLTKNTINIERLMTTKMACSDMEVENKIVRLLPGESSIEISDGLLILKRDNRTIFVFEK